MSMLGPRLANRFAAGSRLQDLRANRFAAEVVLRNLAANCILHLHFFNVIVRFHDPNVRFFSIYVNDNEQAHGHEKD